MSEIKLQVTDQSLSYIINPLIYSGDVNYDSVSFEFSEEWDGFTKTAVFYKTTEHVYYQLLGDSNSCIIPKEVLDEKTNIYIGVFGVNNDEQLITSEVIKYRVRQGVPTDDLEEPDPNPDIWQQILADYNALKTELREAYDTFTEEINTTVSGINTALTNHKSSGDHDGRYYTESEIDTKLAGKSDTTHTHDDRYYTETEVNTLLNGKSNTNHNHNSAYQLPVKTVIARYYEASNGGMPYGTWSLTGWKEVSLSNREGGTFVCIYYYERTA